VEVSVAGLEQGEEGDSKPSLIQVLRRISRWVFGVNSSLILCLKRLNDGELIVMKRCAEMEEAGDNSRKVELSWHGLKPRKSDGWMRNIFKTQFSWHGIRVGTKFPMARSVVNVQFVCEV
jgi:hypothetical protein